MKVKEYDHIVKNIPIDKILVDNSLDIKVVLEGLLAGITDIIGVYKPNGDIIFYNNAGYEFLNITPEESKGKKCYEMLGRTYRCEYCTTEKVISTKKAIRMEKYVPELDRYMDCCCNPVINKDGEIIFVIEQLRDITEKIKIESILRESEEKYRSMVELSPYGILVIADGKIVLVNNEAVKMYGNTKADLLGKTASDIISPEFRSTVIERMKKVLTEKLGKSTYEYKIINYNKEIIDVHVSSSYLSYNGKPAIQSVIRDITGLKRGLTNAGILQRQSLTKAFPLPEKAFMESVFIPAGAVSGDHYCVNKIDDDTVVGVIYDVSGKGFTAALNVGAFNVLFNEAILLHKNPSDIIEYLNKKAAGYLRENYVAACCFSFNFRNNTANIVGAGISRFMITNTNQNFEENIVKGPFIGMFDDSKFDEVSIKFGSGDKFYFFTDGFDDLFENEGFLNYVYKLNDIFEFARYIYDWMEDKPIDNEASKDDSTLLAIQIK